MKLSFSLVGQIFRKEILETIRDRRTLFVMFFLPLALYPVLAALSSHWIVAQQSAYQSRSIHIVLSGGRWSALRAVVAKVPGFVVRHASSDADQIDDHKGSETEDIRVVIPNDFQATLDTEGRIALTLKYDPSRVGMTDAFARLRHALEQLETDLSEVRRQRHQLPDGFNQPIEIHEEVFSRVARNEHPMLAGLLSFLVILMVLLGAFYPAVDLTAGEKERGTLETLLSTPTPRSALVLGKFCAVFTISLTTGIVNLASVGLTIGLGFGDVVRQVGLSSGFIVKTFLLVLPALIPSSIFFSALLVCVASLARSFKEAQTFLTPVYVVCVFPAMVVHLPGISLNGLTALVPGVGIALLTRDIIAGQTEVGPSMMALASTIAYGAVALFVAARIYRSEGLLFRERAPQPGIGDRAAHRRERSDRKHCKMPSPGQAGILLLGVMTLLALVGLPLQARALIPGLLVSEWLIIGVPVIVAIWGWKFYPKSVLALQRPSLRSMAGAGLAGGSGWYVVAWIVEHIQERVLPLPKRVTEAMKALFAQQRPIGLDLFAFALSPAICEEVLFRGFLLSATDGAMSNSASLMVNALLFGAFHLSPYRFLPTGLLGGALAFIVQRTASIIPAVLFHFLNNAAAILLAHTLGPERSESLSSHPILLVVAVMAFLIGIGLVANGRHERWGARSI